MAGMYEDVDTPVEDVDEVDAGDGGDFGWVEALGQEVGVQES